MIRKYYINNESKEEYKRKQYFGLRELKLQTIFFSFFLTSVLSFHVFLFLFLFFELGAHYKIRTKNKEHKRNKIG